MNQRLLTVLVPDIAQERAREVIAEASPLATWAEPAQDEHVLLHALVDLADSERLVGRIESHLADIRDLRMVLVAVEASIPHPEKDEGADGGRPGDPDEPSAPVVVEELYDDIVSGMSLSKTFFVTVILSAVVAAIGVVRNDVAIIIGAMVIAPLLKPNMAMCLGTTLGDLHLLRRAVLINLAGLLVGLVASAPFGLLGAYDPTVAAVAHRTKIGFLDLGLASAAGAAGALALTTGTLSGVVGVMIAVALIPVLAVLGMSLGAGLWHAAFGAGLLLVANVICINLAGVIVFVVQRVRPRAAWEKSVARRAVWTAVALWGSLLLVLAAVLLVAADLRRA
ncbi:MAG: TIGR00341 family protein [Myxococcota bacterium]